MKKCIVATLLVISILGSLYVGYRALSYCPYLVDLVLPTKSVHYTESIPCFEDYLRIASYPYELNVYDCSQKATELFYVLKEAGYDAKIIGTYKRGDRYGHAFVYCPGYGFLDPTWNYAYAIENTMGVAWDFYNHESLSMIHGEIQIVVDESNMFLYADEFNNLKSDNIEFK
jgi:hypothetical protein